MMHQVVSSRFRHRSYERWTDANRSPKYHILIYKMAQSFPYFTSSSTPPPSSRIPSSSHIQQQSVSGSSKRDSILPSSTSTQNVNRQSSLHQQLFTLQQHGGILDRPLNRSKGSEVSAGAWAFLFGEIVSYSQSRVDSVTDLEKRWDSLSPFFTMVRQSRAL